MILKDCTPATFWIINSDTDKLEMITLHLTDLVCPKCGCNPDVPCVWQEETDLGLTFDHYCEACNNHFVHAEFESCKRDDRILRGLKRTIGGEE